MRYDCDNDRGWTRLFKEGVKIVTNLFFYKCKVVHIRWRIILNEKIENCEICLYIVSSAAQRKMCSQLALCQ